MGLLRSPFSAHQIEAVLPRDSARPTLARSRSATNFRRNPWIDHRQPGELEIPNIAGKQAQTIGQGGGGQQTLDGGDGAARLSKQPTSAVRDSRADGQHLAGVGMVVRSFI